MAHHENVLITEIDRDRTFLYTVHLTLEQYRFELHVRSTYTQIYIYIYIYWKIEEVCDNLKTLADKS